MKIKKELNGLEEETKLLNEVLAELSEDDLFLVTGGVIDSDDLTTFDGKSLLGGSHNMKTKLKSPVSYTQPMDEGVSATSKLVTLPDRNGTALNIVATDDIHISQVVDGKQFMPK